MGILLDFASAPKPTSRVRPPQGRAVATNPDHSGEIIMFPGVRYERMALDLSARIGTIGPTAGPAVSDSD